MLGAAILEKTGTRGSAWRWPSGAPRSARSRRGHKPQDRIFSAEGAAVAPGLRGAVAQVVERATHKRVVAGSAPPGAPMLQTPTSNPLLQAIKSSGLIRPGSRVLVAVSGGPDSTALLVALHELGLDVTGAHFDHALRGGSEVGAGGAGGPGATLGVASGTQRAAPAMPP